MENSKQNLLLCCSGSVATIKVPELVIRLSTNFNVKVVATPSALFFMNKAAVYHTAMWDKFDSLSASSPVNIIDDDEWILWNKLGDPVLHIELRQWADILIVAPASADFIGKASAGISDNLALCVLRAWDFKKPCIICPAMNTVMWDHPSTRHCLDILIKWGWRIVGPVEKLLACNEIGNGAMASVDTIVQAADSAMAAASQQSSTAPQRQAHLNTILTTAHAKRQLRVSKASSSSDLPPLWTSCLCTAAAVMLTLIVVRHYHSHY